MKARWQDLAKNLNIQLPAQNPWMTSDFNVQPKIVQSMPKKVIGEDGLSVWWQPSQHFDQPKGSIELNLYSPELNISAKQQAAATLMMSMFERQSQALGAITSVGGTSLNHRVSNQALTISVNDFTQHQPALLKQLISDLKDTQFTQQQLALAKEQALRALNNLKTQNSIQQASYLFSQLKDLDGLTEQQKSKVLKSITLKDIHRLRDRLFGYNYIEMLAVGNYSEKGIKTLARQIKKGIKSERIGPYRAYQPKPLASDIALWRQGQMSDATAIDVFISDLKTPKARATASLLSRLIHPAFYTSLRTEQQLGYVVGASFTYLWQYPGIMFYVQSPELPPAGLIKRFEAFYADYREVLENMDHDRFESVKESLLKDVLESPQTPAKETSHWSYMLEQGFYNFDRTTGFAFALTNVTQEDVIALFDQYVKEKLSRAHLTLQAIPNNQSPQTDIAKGVEITTHSTQTILRRIQ